MAASPTGSGKVDKTGACYDGYHEMSFSEDGMTPKMICRGIIPISSGPKREFVCKCECHANITALFEMTGVERVWPDSMYSPQRRAMQEERRRAWGLDEILRGGEAHKVIRLPDNPDAPAEIVTIDQIIEAGAPADISSQLPPHPPQPVAKPDTQRKGRPPGMLEFEAKLVCDQFALGLVPADPSGGIGAMKISRLIDPVNPPSTGAVTNILRVWRDIGFANIGEGPWRFESYTRAGVQLGSEALRKKYEQDQAAQRRLGAIKQRQDERDLTYARAKERNRRSPKK